MADSNKDAPDWLGDLGKSPGRLGDIPTWADMIEMRCLAHVDRRQSFEAIVKFADADVGHSLEAIELLGRSADGDLDATQFSRHAEQADDDPSMTDEEEEGENGEYAPAAAAPGEKRNRLRVRRRIAESIRQTRPADGVGAADRRHLVAADIARLLAWRAAKFGSDYPFEFITDASGEFVLNRKDSLSERNILYIFLLLCASLPLLETKAEESVYTYPFERLTARALRGIFPSAEVEVFGTSNLEGELPTNLKGRIEHLAKRLAGEVGRDVKHMPEDNRGDGGLDVCAHVPLGDEQEGRFVVFAQAACSEKWVTKQNSATAHTWKNKLVLQVPQVSICAIPMSFRRPGGDWHDMTQMSETLLLDRSRIMHLIREGFDELEAEIDADGRSRASIEALVGAEQL